MLNRVTHKPKGTLRSIADRLLTVGGISFLLCTSGFFPFSEAVRGPVKGIAILLMAISFAITAKLVLKEFRSQRAVEAELNRMKPASAVNSAAKKKEFPAALYLISLAVIALGLSFIFLVPQGYQRYRLQSQASSWPYTTGEVISAEVIVDERGAGFQDDLVQPKIVIQYIVDNRQYVTREIYFNQSTSWSSSGDYAEAMTEKYPPGAQVPVFYNPAEPSVAVLDTSAVWFTYIMMGLGAIFVIFGIYWLWLSLRDTYFFIANFFNKLNS